MRNIKFHHKIYLLTFFLISLFIFSSILHQLSTENISDNIKRLNQKNDSLQNILILVLETEKLHRNVYEFINLGDDELLIYINKVLSKFNSIENNLKVIDSDKKLHYFLKKIIENMDNFKIDFKIAEKEIPKNFNFRRTTREKAQKLEDYVGSLEIEKSNKDLDIELILLKKHLLELEKKLFRYFETDDGIFIEKLKIEQIKLKSFLKKMKENNKFSMKTRKNLEKEILELILISNKTISHYRTYSMITKVIMPGNIYEIDYYAEKIKEMSLNEIDGIKKEIDELLNVNKNTNFIISTLYIALIILTFFLLTRVFLRPIENLTLMFENLIKGKENILFPEYKQDDIIGKLIRAAIKFNSLNKQTNALLKETEDYKLNLEKKVKQEVLLRREKEKALIQQSKLASMGEMIGAIAHQWRQPLNELSIRIQKLKYSYAKEEINEEFIKGFIQKNKRTIDFMSKTIDDFRNFFRIDKEKKRFYIKETIEEVINIQSAQLKNNHIKIELEGKDFEYEGYKTEFQQVIINIISNSKDALVKNRITEPKIKVEIKEDRIEIKDNGGGIDKEIINRVFEPYFTTKQQGEGTGMGLYMSKMIIEDNMGGRIDIKNKNQGVLITIDLKA